jgi:hypothetical protein
MEIRESEIRKVIKILKDATLVIKIAPFVFVLAQILTLLAYYFGNETLSVFLDYCFYLSPSVVILAVFLSLIFKLCRWHRLECLLPIIPTITWLVDEYVTDLSLVAAQVNVGTILLLFILSLINAYFVFLKR